MLEAARAYVGFAKGLCPDGTASSGISNTRLLGGSAIRQHYIILLAGRKLGVTNFQKLTSEVENLMFVYLITNTSSKDYERSIIEGARQLRNIDEGDFPQFCTDFFGDRKTRLSRQFDQILNTMYSWEARAFRVRYLLAKLTQALDIRAYGGHSDLQQYYGPLNDVEHIFPLQPSKEAIVEFGGMADQETPSRIGNLMLVEQAINRSLGNRPYSQKKAICSQSQYLLVKCQAQHPTFGTADQITRAIAAVPAFEEWNTDAVKQRQLFLTKLACEVWGMNEV